MRFSIRIFNKGRSSCLQNFGEPGCSVNMARSFKFQTGRADCVEVITLAPAPITCFFGQRDVEYGFKATKAEHHPNPVGNGQSTIEFFRESFATTGREVVALMGAHTFGMSVGLLPLACP